MPFNGTPFAGIARPKDLKFLTAALDEHCRAVGIQPGTQDHMDAARRVILLFGQGIDTPEKMAAALKRDAPGLRRVD
jgi:hypothetical protein